MSSEKSLLERFGNAQRLSAIINEAKRREHELPGMLEDLERSVTRQRQTTGDPLLDMLAANRSPDKETQSACEALLKKLESRIGQIIIQVMVMQIGKRYSTLHPDTRETVVFYYIEHPKVRTATRSSTDPHDWHFALGERCDYVCVQLGPLATWDAVVPTLTKGVGILYCSIKPKDARTLATGTRYMESGFNNHIEWAHLLISQSEIDAWIAEHPHSTHVRRVYEEACTLLACPPTK